MNSACIIAACAVNSRLSQEQKRREDMYTQYFTKDFDLYYNIRFRKYYHFERVTLVKPDYEPFYVGSIYAPVKYDVMLHTVEVEPKSIVVERQFTIRASKCTNGVDNYIKDNLEYFTTSGLWFDSDRQAIDLYVNELNKKYDIDLDSSSLKYTNQFCWEVESDVH